MSPSNNEVTIIIPTMDNRQYLEPCVQSILAYTADVLYRIIVVNNGVPGSCDWLPKTDLITVLEAGGNRGWEGGLQLGITVTRTFSLLFLNDDTVILRTQRRWLADMLRLLEGTQVAAVGPSSNCVAGAQSRSWVCPTSQFDVRFLIGFCLLVKRAALEAVGGIDQTLPGGDDIDLSIRLRHAGWRLICAHDVVVYHYGFKTGVRVHGVASKPGGWNSKEFTNAVTAALVAKHGRDAVNETWGTIVA